MIKARFGLRKEAGRSKRTTSKNIPTRSPMDYFDRFSQRSINNPVFSHNIAGSNEIARDRHSTIIDENMPVVALAPRDPVYGKVVANIEEVKARNGKVIAVVSDDSSELGARVDHVIQVPQTIPALLPVLTSIPLQLLAYHAAIHRGCDVDQPRNLAKSVTVE